MAGSGDETTRVTRRALLVWLAAVAVYITATTGRTSFGVAGVAALDHFQIDASRVAVFTAVQVGVYSLMQIPMGLAVDRFGPRRMLVVGAVIMAVGQIILGLTDSYAIAVSARVLIGAGDATAFLSVLRMLPNWFPLRRAPVMMQLTSALGQLGQVLSAVPFAAILYSRGWVTAFVSLGATGLIVAVAATLVIRDAPDSVRGTSPGPPVRLATALRCVLTHPACWQGFFTHFTCIFPQIVFTLIWGVPLMSLGLGLDQAQISTALVANMVVIMLASPLAGLVSGRAGRSRDLLVVISAAILAGIWVWFLLPSEPRAYIALMVVNLIMAMVSPAGNFAFDTVREHLDRRVLAAGTGLANMGGFTGGMIATQGIGVLLDVAHTGGGPDYVWSDFRLAGWAALAVWTAGIMGFLLSRRALRKRRGDHHQPVLRADSAAGKP
ncbi:MFS transporter [Corynebacterium sp. P7202]|uniref:MFS transporter n=1 Tax=Corynebacterium pygosceleis TaxID=2800406 RepID=A0A9Q4GKE8_9CORY|nr:MFS transporter [Corynebacterium pygosceleis]MCK7636592.1 MFS transporter [Corynebacterium pygosceleis]MCX7444170.1 MFS transporter [Corynebacterium pygosceleis]MCX7467345.1 MFS transporter [Corynebacterium pygosceleis]